MSDQALRVLIVDDDQLQLELMERSLRLEGFQVATSSSVFGVSNIMRSFSPDVMLIDVHIPALSGDQLLSLARRNAPEGTKFVLYSSCDEWRLRALARETNADGWISKSADGPAVAKKLREVCGLQRPSGPPSAPPSMPTMPASTPASPTSPTSPTSPASPASVPPPSVPPTSKR